tara:strand:- start:476 stop:736 length:261 start_codon:yes stop_codon:yes gene_type:complete
MSDKDTTVTEKLGGRKSSAFYACLACILILALMDKAETHILGLIDTLFLVYAGANVMIKPKQLEAKAQAKADNSPDPKPTDSMEKP